MVNMIFRNLSYMMAVFFYKLIFKIFKNLFYAVLSLFKTKEKSTDLLNEYVLNYVVDGDTFSFKNQNNEDFRLRLYGVDTPEKYTSEKLDRETKNSNSFFNKLLNKNVTKEEIIESGKLASNAVKSVMENGKSYKLDLKNKDKHGRFVGVIYVDGENLNQLLVKEGIAVIVEGFLSYSDLSIYRNLEKSAKLNKNGLWKDYGNVMKNMK